MKVNNEELIAKWGFWLIFYAIFSPVLIFLAFSMVLLILDSYHSFQVSLSYVLITLIILPCLVGGFYYLNLGVKFRSLGFLCMGVVPLLMASAMCFIVYMFATGAAFPVPR